MPDKASPTEKAKIKRSNNTSLAGQQVVTRFFVAINELVNREILGGISTFTSKYDIDRRNFTRIAEEPNRKFDAGWLHYLVKDYGVSADWLLTGKGKMFTKEPEE